MDVRPQKTLQTDATVSGVGLFTNADVALRFVPADEDHGIRFVRTDLTGSASIPATIDFVAPRTRRTALEHQGVSVEMIEHVMAALAGLHVDNCLVELDAIEPPNGDGSAQHFVDALLGAGIVEQSAPRPALLITLPCSVSSDDSIGWINTVGPENDSCNLEDWDEPTESATYRLSYALDYGTSAIPKQSVTVDINPASFHEELAFCRTFVLESEVEQLRSKGFGLRTTAQDLLVFRNDGSVVDNQLHCPDECARHKALDCVGDFALLGCDLIGTIQASQSGHRLNHQLVRAIKMAHRSFFNEQAERRAA